MSSPGWYPDPSGQPNSFRYWDGQAWGNETRPLPTQPMPTQPPPSQSPPSPPSGWTPMGAPPSAPPPTGAAGKRVALVLLVVVLVAGVAVGGFFGVRALTDDSDDSTATDDTSESASPSETESETPLPSETPTEQPSTEAPPPTEAPATPLPGTCTSGSPLGGKAPGAVLRGGGLQAPAPEGFAAMGLDAAFTFADKVVTVGRAIEPQWAAVYALGGLDKAVGYANLEQAAESVLTCMTGSDIFYSGFSGRTDQGSSSITVTGHEAWRITSEVRVDNPEVTAEGDVVTVVVVDTGAAGSYGLFVSLVPIGNADLIGQQEQVVGALEVR